MSNKDVGNSGEETACRYLQKQGYKILGRNYRIRGGEIDIVAKDKEALVFVEVKTRWSHEYGSPAESMTPWKIKFILKTVSKSFGSTLNSLARPISATTSLGKHFPPKPLAVVTSKWESKIRWSATTILLTSSYLIPKA